MPQEAVDLTISILAMEPTKRPSIRKILDSPYIKKFYKGFIPPAPVSHNSNKGTTVVKFKVGNST